MLYALAADKAQINLEHPNDPKSVPEALASSKADEWRAAMEEELKSIKDIGVYKFVLHSTVPKGRKIMKGNLRYVLLGHKMIYGRDYTR